MLVPKTPQEIQVFNGMAQTTWEYIKNWYIQAHILTSPNWELEFHVHTYLFQLVVRVILDQIPTSKIDQHVMYSSRLFNYTKKNYTTTKKEALTIVYALHKFRHYMLGNKFTFYVNHMAFVYLVNKPQVYSMLTRCLLLFMEYNFKIIYKHGKSHLMANALIRLPNQTEPIGIPIQTCDAHVHLTTRVVTKCLCVSIKGGDARKI
jgi:hypothetical protein